MNLQAQIDRSFPSTGDWLKADTAVATVPTYLIKQANAKMIERLYLIDINKQQDSIIIMKNDYILEQKRIILDFQQRIDNVNRINGIIVEDLNKQKKYNKIITFGGGSIILALLIGLIAK